MCWNIVHAKLVHKPSHLQECHYYQYWANLQTKSAITRVNIAGGVPVDTSDARCTHLVVEDSVTELPSGLLDQSHFQAVKQEVSPKIMLQVISVNLS